MNRPGTGDEGLTAALRAEARALEKEARGMKRQADMHRDEALRCTLEAIRGVIIITRLQWVWLALLTLFQILSLMGVIR